MRLFTGSSFVLAVVGLIALVGSAGGGIGGMVLLGLVVLWWRRVRDRERTGL